MLVDLDAPGWFLDEREVLKGNRVKYTATAIDGSASPDPDILRWVWKTSKTTYPLEFWSEVIAAEIGHAMGIEVPRAHPAVYGGTFGALMANFVDREAGEVLDHGGDLLLSVKPDYDRRKGRGHSVQLIRRMMDHWGLTEGCYPWLFSQWLFDAVIGNQDRHQDNWGLVVTLSPDGSVHVVDRVAPAFDNGSSLCRELTEDGVAALLGDPARLERYVARGKAHVRWEEGGGNLIEVEHEELIRHHLESFPETTSIAEVFLSRDLLEVEDAIHRVCKGSRDYTDLPISLAREALIWQTVKLRITRLQRLVGLD